MFKAFFTANTTATIPTTVTPTTRHVATPISTRVRPVLYHEKQETQTSSVCGSLHMEHG
jgi:hypothetical protein